MSVALSPSARAETFVAARNALKLGSALLLTWGTSLAVKLLVPRYLGPAVFGELSFADAFAATFFVALTLGIDLYIRKEVSVRLEHASDFFGGTVLLRVALTAALAAGMFAVLDVTHRPAQVRSLVFLYAAAQLFMSLNSTLSAILHCAGRVDGVSVISVVTKVLWAGGCAAAIALRLPLWAFPLSVLAGEVLECGVLYALARRHAGLRFRVDRRATVAALAVSFPFYVNTATHVAYARLDVTLLDAFADPREVGWYSAAQTFASLTMLITPLFGWVCMPILARAAARSRADFYALVRRALEYTVGAAIPVSVAIALGADVWVAAAFGPRFAPAVTALRILAPIAAVTYVAVIASCCMTLIDQGWRLTFISLVGLLVNAALNLRCIPLGIRFLGPAGGGGAGAAMAALGTELIVTAAMLWSLGRNAFDLRSVVRMARLLAVSLGVAALDHALLRLGPRRLLVDGAVFVLAALAVRAVDVDELLRFLRAALASRRGEPADAPS